MRSMNGLSLPVLCVALLAGCATNVHDPQSWIPPSDTEKATSDWDVAEGICDKIASGTELTAEEKAQIEFDQEMQMMAADIMADTGRQMADMANQYGGDPSLGHAAQVMGTAMSLFGAFGGATAEEDKKQEAFLECMDRLGWEMQDGG